MIYHNNTQTAPFFIENIGVVLEEIIKNIEITMSLYITFMLSNKYDKKLDRNIKMTEKESIKNHFLFKSYNGFNPGTFLE